MSEKIETGILYAPKDPSYRGGLNAKPTRKSEKKRTVSYWCGGQYLKEDYDDFLRRYKPGAPRIDIPQKPEVS